MQHQFKRKQYDMRQFKHKIYSKLNGIRKMKRILPKQWKGVWLSPFAYRFHSRFINGHFCNDNTEEIFEETKEDFEQGLVTKSFVHIRLWCRVRGNWRMRK